MAFDHHNVNAHQRPGVHIGSDGLFGQHPSAMEVGLVQTRKPTMRGRASLSCYPTRIALPVVPSTPRIECTPSNPNVNTPRNGNRNRMNPFSSVLRGLNEFDPPNSAPPMAGITSGQNPDALDGRPQSAVISSKNSSCAKRSTKCKGKRKRGRPRKYKRVDDPDDEFHAGLQTPSPKKRKVSKRS